MDARGTLLLSNFITSYDAKIQSLILHLLFTKSLKRGNIYKLCLLTTEGYSNNIDTLNIQYSKPRCSMLEYINVSYIVQIHL